MKLKPVEKMYTSSFGVRVYPATFQENFVSGFQFSIPDKAWERENLTHKKFLNNKIQSMRMFTFVLIIVHIKQVFVIHLVVRCKNPELKRFLFPHITNPRSNFVRHGVSWH